MIGEEKGRRRKMSLYSIVHIDRQSTNALTSAFSVKQDEDVYPAVASGCACMYSLTSRDPNGVSMTSSRDPRANTPLPHYLIPRHRNCLGYKNIIGNEWLDDPNLANA